MTPIRPADLDDDLVARFKSLVDCTGGPDACWPWRGNRLAAGYGRIQHRGVAYRAHRIAFVLENTVELDVDEHLDHTCHTRALDCPGGSSCAHRLCCNPAHLEPVTLVENVMRGRSAAARNAQKTHCQRGHELSPSNVTIMASGGRRCNTCAGITGRGQGHLSLKTHCLRGHEFTAENTRINGRRRFCRTCQRGRARAYREKQGLPPQRS